MSPLNLDDLPTELIYYIFEYLKHQEISYSFLEINDIFQYFVLQFIGRHLSLIKDDHPVPMLYSSLDKLIPIIGPQLSRLSLAYQWIPTSYLLSIRQCCPNLECLIIYCSTNPDDIRRCITTFLNKRTVNFNVIYHGLIVAEDLSRCLLNRCKEEEEECSGIYLAPAVDFHLSSIEDLTILKQFSMRSFIPDGLYKIQSTLTTEWLIDSDHDLCLVSASGLNDHGLFVIKQNDRDQLSREYQIFNFLSRCPLTIVKTYHDDEERWFSSSILSTHRKLLSHTCSNFVFEKVNNNHKFYIRPVYEDAQRLQVCGKRIILSYSAIQNTADHHFQLQLVTSNYLSIGSIESDQNEDFIQ